MRPGPAAAVALLAGAVLALSAASALAERHPEHMITLAFQTEHADVVAVARPTAAEVDPESGTTTAVFEVDETIRGDVAPGTRLTVLHRELGHGRPWRDGARHLVFLRAIEGPQGSPRYESLSGAFGFRPLIAGEPSERFPVIAAAIAATLDADGTVARPAELGTLLAHLATDPDDGIASSSALDLVRHQELLPALTAEQRAALAESFRARRPGRTRRQLALAVAAARPPDAARTLVDALLEPGSERDRTGIAEALHILADPAAETRALERLTPADPVQKEHLLVALGAIGGPRSLSAVRALVAAPEAAVRVQAAHTLGLVARNVHRAAPETAVAGRVELLALQQAAATQNEERAAIWALAQLDDPAAYDALRALAAATDTPERVRAYVTRILERPRVALILD